MSKTKSFDQNTQESILLEYKICDSQVSRIDRLIWQTASIIFPITLAALAYFGSTLNISYREILIEIIVAIGSISIMLIWSQLALQWHGYQAIAFHRMHEIEKELGMWHYRYSLYLRLPSEKRQDFIQLLSQESESQENVARYRKAEEEVIKFGRFSVRLAIKLITLISVIAWIFITMLKLVLITVNN